MNNILNKKIYDVSDIIQRMGEIDENNTLYENERSFSFLSFLLNIWFSRDAGLLLGSNSIIAWYLLFEYYLFKFNYSGFLFSWITGSFRVLFRINCGEMLTEESAIFTLCNFLHFWRLYGSFIIFVDINPKFSNFVSLSIWSGNSSIELSFS